MVRSDALNLHVYPVRTETTGKKQIPTLYVCSTDESELKEFLLDKNILQIYSTDGDESKSIIVDKCSMDEDKQECVHKNIIKQKDANIEAEYEKTSVIDEVPTYFNIFECGRNILNRLDVTYERACMATPKEE